MGSELKVRKLKQVIAVPRGQSGGGLIVDSAVDEETFFKPDRKAKFDPAEYNQVDKQIVESCIFAGYLLPHYGHFLLESLGRIWFIKQRPDLPIVWITRHSGYSALHQQIFDILGISNRAYFVGEPTRLRKVLIPASGFPRRQDCHPTHAAALGVWPASLPLTDKKVWISRTHLNTHGGDRAGFTNEADVEGILQSRGWQIIHPQEHTVRDQLAMFAEAQHLAGIEGSAFHTALLLEKPQAKLSIVARRRGLHQNFNAIAKVKHLKQRAIWASFEVMEEDNIDRKKTRATWVSPAEVAASVDAPWLDENAIESVQ